MTAIVRLITLLLETIGIIDRRIPKETPAEKNKDTDKKVDEQEQQNKETGRPTW